MLSVCVYLCMCDKVSGWESIDVIQLFPPLRGNPFIGGPSAHTVQGGPCWSCCHGDPVPHAALPDHGVQAGRVLPGPVHQATRSSIEEPQWTGKAILLPQLDYELELWLITCGVKHLGLCL